MDAHDRIPPDPAISRLDSPNIASAEPSGTRRIRQIDEDRHWQISILPREEVLGPPPLFGRLAGPQTVGRLRCSKGGRGRKGDPVQDRTNPTITGSGRSHPPDLAGQGATTDASPLLLDASRRRPQAPAMGQPRGPAPPNRSPTSSHDHEKPPGHASPADHRVGATTDAGEGSSDGQEGVLEVAAAGSPGVALREERLGRKLFLTRVTRLSFVELMVR
jgi:hypothetical protein